MTVFYEVLSARFGTVVFAHGAADIKSMRRRAWDFFGRSDVLRVTRVYRQRRVED